MPRSETWFNQRERRFQPQRDQALNILRALGSELPQITYAEGSVRTLVVTTYLDTPERDYLRMVEDSQGQISLKMRIREYLPLYDDDRPDAKRHVALPVCYLERKERAGDIRQKQRVMIEKRKVGAVVRREQRLQGTADVVAALDGELSQRVLEPVVVSAYERRVFGSEHGLRVTFDERLRFHVPPPGLYDQHDALDPTVLGDAAAPGPGRILEIKEPGGTPTPPWLEELIAGITEIGSYSKFRDGMRALIDNDGGERRPLTRPLIAIK